MFSHNNPNLQFYCHFRSIVSHIYSVFCKISKFILLLYIISLTIILKKCFLKHIYIFSFIKSYGFQTFQRLQVLTKIKPFHLKHINIVVFKPFSHSSFQTTLLMQRFSHIYSLFCKISKFILLLYIISLTIILKKCFLKHIYIFSFIKSYGFQTFQRFQVLTKIKPFHLKHINIAVFKPFSHSSFQTTLLMQRLLSML